MMQKKAKIFSTRTCQAVCLPPGFRFGGAEVLIRRDPVTGDVILSQKPATWDGLFALYDTTEVPNGFMSAIDRNQGAHARDPFEDEPEV